MSKYEQTILEVVKTTSAANEKLINLTNRLYDKDGDIPKIIKHLEMINHTNDEQQQEIEANRRTIALQEQRMGSFPLNILSSIKFWLILVIAIICLAGGLEYDKIYDLVSKVFGLI